MDDAAVAVAAFASQVVAGIGVCVARKRHALRNQPVKCRLCMLDHIARGSRITQAGTSGQRVLYVFGESVFPRKYGSDTALRRCARPVHQGFLGDDGDLLLVSELQRQG